MTANKLCNELAFMLQYLEVRYKKTNLTYTNAGQRQFTFYVFHNADPMSFEEVLIADTVSGAVVHTDNITFSVDNIFRHNGRIDSFDLANHFYDSQT
jgi:hypothetical protein